MGKDGTGYASMGTGYELAYCISIDKGWDKIMGIETRCFIDTQLA